MKSITLFSFGSHARSKFIAIASLIFYATWYPPAVLLLLFHALLGIYGGRYIVKYRKKVVLASVIILALLPLLIFKYYHFFIDLVGLEGVHFDLILPIGLSFYTFSMIGYYVDLYEEKVQYDQNFLDLLLFIAFWPHLAAGPILRAKNIFTNIFKEEPLSKRTVTIALVLISIGLIKKLLVADNIGAYVNWNLSYGVLDMNILEAWATMLGFSAQIYADFSGYSDMAIGFALLMGFKLPANFNYPYRATTVTEFWHRWHISLSTWFRDYLYFPLGGNRKGVYRTYFNIMLVFVLSGIWHGAGIGFAIWGAIHGAILVMEKIVEKSYYKLAAWIRWLITMTVIILAWSFFRLDYADAVVMVEKMFGFHESLFLNDVSPYYVVVILLMLVFPLLDHLCRFYRVDKEGFPIVNRSFLSLMILSLLIFAALLFSGSPLPFIYFEF
jgi:alginate O-acetyltransferase complex protein AlgI